MTNIRSSDEMCMMRLVNRRSIKNSRMLKARKTGKEARGEGGGEHAW